MRSVIHYAVDWRKSSIDFDAAPLRQRL